MAKKTTFEKKVIPVSQLQENTGQIEGLPKNPRFIKDERYHKLRASIIEDPEMLELRELIVTPCNGKYVILGGNMRYRVMLELEHKQAPCKVVPEDAPLKKKQAYVIKDNVSFGDMDWDNLEYDEWGGVDQLEDWGMEVWRKPEDDAFDLDDEQEDEDSSGSDTGPKITDDGYSAFELIMLHENKVQLVTTLNRIKEENSFEKTETALMHLISIYDAQN